MAMFSSRQPNNNGGEPVPQQQQVKSHFQMMLEDVTEAHRYMEHFATCASSLTLIAQKHLNALDKIRADLTSAIGEPPAQSVEQAIADFVPKNYRAPEADAGSRES